MQRWEYVFVRSLDERGQPRPMRVNGEELRDWRRVPLYTITATVSRAGSW